MATINLLGNTSRVETPFIKITIGNYTFGVFDKVVAKDFTNPSYTIMGIKYPNYVQSLNIEKVNGVVNKYTLYLKYAVTEVDDPNFFYKVFSSVSKTRKITFSYGDLSAPTFCYRDEEAIILKVKQKMSASSSVIEYTVSAVSTGTLTNAGSYSFTTDEWVGSHQASTLIRKLLNDKSYGLQEVFYGMSDSYLVDTEGLIPSNDIVVDIKAKVNISPIDYLLYLVSCMKSSKTSELVGDEFYNLVVMDDVSGKFKGPYFKIVKVEHAESMPLAYNLDIGYPSQNIVTEFDIEDDEGYTIFYNFYEHLNEQQYVKRINDRGELEDVYAPVVGSANYQREVSEAEKTWWTKITEFPINAKITIKGLLKPAILMTHIRLNVYFYGRKHISSGLYIVTKQVDNISTSGFRTTLSLLRVGKANDLDII